MRVHHPAVSDIFVETSELIWIVGTGGSVLLGIQKMV